MPKTKPIPDGFHTVTPYLIVDDAAAVIAFLEKAFDAKHDHAPTMRPDGRVMHATLQVGSSRLMIGSSSEMAKPNATMLYLYVEDVDAVYRKAVAAGGTSVMEPTTMFYGDRAGAVSDPAGNHLWIASKVDDVAADELQRRVGEMFNAGGKR